MPEYKLTYFNIYGRAEFIRWLFAYGDIPYTDDRIGQGEWPTRKQSIPSGQVPILMIDDKMLPQSLAIARYVAKEAGLVPQDNVEAAYCDAVVDTCNDLRVEFAKIRYGGGSQDEKNRKFTEELIPNKINPVLTRLNKRLGDGRDSFISGKITWADVVISESLHFFKTQHPSLLKEFPSVEALVNRVTDSRQIKNWLKKRPVSDY